MKYVLYLVLCLLPTTTYCQDSYLFDKVLEYEVKEPSESVDKDMETRFYFINTKDNSYVAIAIERADGTYTLVFRDDKKKKIAELVVDENAIFRMNKLSLKKRFLKDNRYRNLVDVNDYTIAISKKDSLTEEYTYTYKRGNWQNRYKTKKTCHYRR